MGKWIGIMAASLLFLGPHAVVRAAELDRARPCALDSEKLFTLMTRLPTPPYVALEEGRKFLLSASLFASVLGSPPQSFIINDVNELRFITTTLFKSPLLLVLEQAARFDSSRLEKVLPVAKLQEIPVFVLWINDLPPPPELERLARETGGRLWTRDELKAQLTALCLS